VTIDHVRCASRKNRPPFPHGRLFRLKAASRRWCGRPVQPFKAWGDRGGTALWRRPRASIRAECWMRSREGSGEHRFGDIRRRLTERRSTSRRLPISIDATRWWGLQARPRITIWAQPLPQRGCRGGWPEEFGKTRQGQDAWPRAWMRINGGSLRGFKSRHLERVITRIPCAGGPVVCRTPAPLSRMTRCAWIAGKGGSPILLLLAAEIAGVLVKIQSVCWGVAGARAYQ